MKKLILGFIVAISLAFNACSAYDYFYPSPEDLDLKDPFVKESLNAIGISQEYYSDYIVKSNNFIAFEGGVICVIFYPLQGMGSQNISCFNFDTGEYLGGLNYGLKSMVKSR